MLPHNKTLSAEALQSPRVAKYGNSVVLALTDRIQLTLPQVLNTTSRSTQFQSSTLAFSTSTLSTNVFFSKARTTVKPDSAAKRARQAEKRRIYNKGKKSEVKTRMKKAFHFVDDIICMIFNEKNT